MTTAYFKRGLIVAAIYMACAGTIQAEPFTGNDKKGNNNNTTTNERQVKQRKPNLYVRFFNRVYNKYAKKHAEEAAALKANSNSKLSNTK